MNRPSCFLITLCLSAASLLGPGSIRAADDAAFTRTEDVVYGRKHGMALTMDVFTPKEHANGAAVVWMVSGGWFSAHEAINSGMIQEFLNRGYTVFAVVHGSQPKFTIPEVVADVNRAVRFIRFHAKDYKIDPDRLGVTGASAGGHLSLMLGTAGDAGDPNAKDPVNRVSSRVQAVACFFPPTDFLNYGKPGENAPGAGHSQGVQGAVRLQPARPRQAGLPRDRRRIEDPRNRPRDQPGVPRHRR